jgi:autotransporter-associated beta strand protein
LSLPSSILVTPQVGAGTSTVSTNIKFGNTAQTGMNVFQYNIGAPLILSGTLSYGSASSGPLTKVGPGELIISGINNSYTGLTILNGGITNIAADLSLGAAPTTAVANQLTFNGGTLQSAPRSTPKASPRITPVPLRWAPTSRLGAVSLPSSARAH